MKAHVTRATASIPPYIHDLLKLSTLSGLDLSADQSRFLARFNLYCLRGRYPEEEHEEVPKDVAVRHLREAGKMFKWLKMQLSSQ